MSQKAEELTSKKLLIKNTLWNMIGLTLPMLVSVFAVPILIHQIGTDKFGLLSVIWMGVGYFTLFDFGISRALTLSISELLGKNSQEDEVIETALTGITGIVILGFIGSTVIFFLSETITTRMLNIKGGLIQESILAFKILGFGVPVVTFTTALIGILEAYQRFDLINKVKIIFGIMTFLAPMIVSLYSSNLIYITASLVVIRILTSIIYFFMTIRLINFLISFEKFKINRLIKLIGYGGWFTTSSVVSPIMSYLDRFFVGSTLSLSAVTFYTAPYDILTRIQLIPSSISNVLFPALTTSYIGSRARFKSIYQKSIYLISSISIPTYSFFFLFAPELLRLWLNPDFAENSTLATRWLTVGLIINSIARVPYTMLQSIGRPDLTAKIHLIELVPYIFLLWFLTLEFGIAGTASAWTIRVIADTVILTAIAQLNYKELNKVTVRIIVLILILCLVFALLNKISSLTLRLLIFLIFCLVCYYCLRKNLASVNH